MRNLMILPPLAQLRRVHESMDELTAILQRALEPASRFRRERANPQNDLELAVLLHGLNALSAAKAIRKLSDPDTGSGIMPHVRTLFEALTKILWMRADTTRASNYLASEPFERYRLATPKVRASDKWPAIMRDCECEFAGNPELAKLKKAVGLDGKPNYKQVAHGLQMPNLFSMVKELGLDNDDYLLDGAVPSLYPHSDIIHTRAFFKRENADGSVLLSEEVAPEMLMAYASRSLVWIGSVCQQLLELFPNGAVQHDAEQAVARLNELAERIRAQFGRPQ